MALSQMKRSLRRKNGLSFADSIFIKGRFVVEMRKSMDDMLQVGVITSTHGIRGQVKVFPTTDDPKRYDQLKEVILLAGEEQRKLTIQQVSYFKQMVIVKFKEYNDINDVEKYRGGKLYVTREQAVPLEENEYFVADLVGLDVFCEDGTAFGTLVDVLPTGANDVYVVKMSDDKEVLLPAIQDCIRSVDVKNKKMIIHLMDGLLD